MSRPVHEDEPHGSFPGSARCRIPAFTVTYSLATSLPYIARNPETAWPLKEGKTMKTLTMHSLVAVAALAVAAVSASAQSYKAEIPMAFHAGDKALAAGTYKLDVVSSNHGNPIFTISNTASGRGA